MAAPIFMGLYRATPSSHVPGFFQMVLNDPTRSQAAFSILGQVEVWRVEHGRPTGEQRPPMIESGVPWPLLLSNDPGTQTGDR
jgi:hypothetical protein